MPYTDEFMSLPGTYAAHGDSLSPRTKTMPVALDTRINEIINTDLKFLREEFEEALVPERKRRGWVKVARAALRKVKVIARSRFLSTDAEAELGAAQVELENAIDGVTLRPLRELQRCAAALNRAARLQEKHDLGLQALASRLEKAKKPKPSRTRLKTKLRVGDLELDHVVVDCPDKTRFRLTWDPHTNMVAVLVLSRGTVTAPPAVLVPSGLNAFKFGSGKGR